MAGNSERLKSTKKGSSRLPEMLVNNVYFCRKERTALQLPKMIVAALTAFLTAISTTSCMGVGPF